MLKRGLVILTISCFVNSLIGCAGRSWISADEEARLQQKRQQEQTIEVAQLQARKIMFRMPGASYDRTDGSISGISQDGVVERVLLDSLEKCTIGDSNNEIGGKKHDYTPSMIMSRLKNSSVEQIYAIRLKTDSMSSLKFQHPYGRFWLYDTSLVGTTVSGENIDAKLSQVHSVQVSRFSTGKTILFVGGAAAAAVGILAIIWGSGSFFGDWHR